MDLSSKLEAHKLKHELGFELKLELESLSLRLSLKRQHAEPLWSALRGNSALRNLELSYCKLDDNVLAMLCQVLPSLPHLSLLDISYNNLTSSSLTSLSRLCCPSLTKLSSK